MIPTAVTVARGNYTNILIPIHIMIAIEKSIFIADFALSIKFPLLFTHQLFEMRFNYFYNFNSPSQIKCNFIKMCLDNERNENVKSNWWCGGG